MIFNSFQFSLPAIILLCRDHSLDTVVRTVNLARQWRVGNGPVAPKTALWVDPSSDLTSSVLLLHFCEAFVAESSQRPIFLGNRAAMVGVSSSNAGGGRLSTKALNGGIA